MFSLGPELLIIQDLYLILYDFAERSSDTFYLRIIFVLFEKKDKISVVLTSIIEV
jgi:hypothetical protein